MSSSDRRAVVLSLLALPLAGCGFTPVYGPGGAAEGLRGQIRMDEPSDREGFLLVRALERRLGLPENARYALSASIRLGEEGIGITADQVITRFQVRGEVTYALTDLVTGRRVTSGTVSNFTSYSTTGTTVATRTAEDSARERFMVVLADQIVARLLATAADWRT